MGRHRAPYEPVLPPWARRLVLYVSCGLLGSLIGLTARWVVS